MAAETAEPSTGISEALAESRATRVQDLRYALHLSIPADRHWRVRGRARLDFHLTDDTTPLLIDFASDSPGALTQAAVNGTSTILQHRSGHIVVPPEHVRERDNTIDLLFEAGDGPLNRRDDLMYSLFVPARAHEAIPCFDQPSIRARWSVTLEIPVGWSAVSNGAELSHPLAADAIVDSAKNGCVTVSFAETEPIPTYLLAFAAGCFTVESRICAGRTMRIFHRESERTRLTRSLDAIVQLHEQALTWLESYAGIPYPFATLDVLIIPAFQFSGMEHPGAIYYNAGALLLDEGATRQQILARAHLIAHETAHMWFGDLVTMRWFSDVWMKEVFANFFAAKIVASLLPDMDHELSFLHAHYPAAYDVDRTEGANPIRQPLNDLLDAGSLYGPIVYLKSPIVMRQLERMLGVDALRDALRLFLHRFAFDSASWPDLLALLQQQTARDLRTWSRDWIEEAGRPVVQSRVTTHDGRIARLTLVTLDSRRDRHCHWPQDLTIALGYAGRIEHVPVHLDGETEVRSARERAVPDFVLPNGAGLGYGAFQLDARSRAWLMTNLPAVEDPLTRASAWLTLWDAMLDREVTPQAIVNLALAALPAESSDLTTMRILAYVERTFWIFLSSELRDQYAPHIESALRSGMARTAEAPLKAVYLATLKTMATTPETLEWFEALWRGDERIPGLPLGESDRISLVKELAIRDRPGNDALLDEQIAHTTDSDRQAALVFVRPALSSTPADRDRFFRSLQDATNRRREPWAIEGLRWLHHPLRQGSAIDDIEPGLAMLDEVRRTGDIFFPQRWADAILSGHSSPEAALVVRRFLESRPPGYPDALKKAVAVGADMLFRKEK